MTREEIDRVVKETFKNIIQDSGKSIKGEPNSTTALMGSDTLFDSVDLVTFIVALEQVIEDDWNISIVLANDKAMSQTVSPFKSIGSITDYIEMLINDK